MNVKLTKTNENEKEKFIVNIQAAFKKSFIDEFGQTDREIISREDIIKSFNSPCAEIYNIIYENKIAGGLVVIINKKSNVNEKFVGDFL